MEIRLLRRQVWIGYANVIAAVGISAGLLLLTYAQWRTADAQWKTAESTAEIERARSHPHFRIKQENHPSIDGFLPRTFRIEAQEGVADAVEAVATTFMIIHYRSRELGVRGLCRATIHGFYAWGNDATTFDLTGEATGLIYLSRHWTNRRHESAVLFQPLQLIADVSFVDIFGNPGRQQLLIMAGRSRQLGSLELRAESWAGVELTFLLDIQQNVAAFRMGDRPISRECVDALRVMDRAEHIRVARHYGYLRLGDLIIYDDDTVYRDRERPITQTWPVAEFVR